jgi:serine/threonine-protein kinase
MQIEGYEIGEVLERDGPTTLYRGRQLSLDRPVVVEILDSDAAVDPALRASVDAECRRLSGLLHPNLVSGLACGEIDGRPYIVTERFDGETLADVVARDGRFGEERALEVGLQIARALTYLEEASLLHGDLSPETTLLSADEVVKLGRIPAVREPGWNGLHRSGRSAGTAGYRSPEAQAGGDARLDGRSDVYALGGILYFLLSGISPAEDAVGEMVDGAIIDRPVPLRARRKTLGKETLRLVARLMAPQPGDRAPSAAALDPMIEHALEEADQRTRVRSGRGHVRRVRTRRPVAPGEGRPRRRRRRRR